MSARNPKKVVDAFAPVGTQPKGCDLKLGEFTAGTVLLLQQLGHPLLEGSAGISKTAKAPVMSDVQIMQLVYILAHPAEIAFDRLAAGREAFDRAVYLFAATIPLGALPELGATLAAAFSRAVSTVLPTGNHTGSKKKAK